MYLLIPTGATLTVGGLVRSTFLNRPKENMYFPNGHTNTNIYWTLIMGQSHSFKLNVCRNLMMAKTVVIAL